MRKNTVKKILAALLALGAISALTACNNSQTTAQSTAESSKSVSESSTESSQESSKESSSKSSVESSKAVSESSVESSKESSVIDPDASKTFSKSDVIRYGKTIVAAEAIDLDYSAIDQLNSNTYVCILKINDDSYNILLHGKAASIEKKYVELLEEGFVPDSSKIDFLIN